MQQRRPVRRALLSVSDKAGIVEFAQALSARGVELLSTGGTARLLAEKGLPVTEVSDYTGFPEMMDGRVKTLHPKVHGGILGRRGQDDAIMEEHQIQPIDMVVVNLYPFAQTVAREGCSLEDAVENIDIGGPTMVKYTYTVIPALVMTWCLSYIERWVDSITPAVTKNFLKPMLIVLIAAPLAILLIGPIGIWIGSAISALVYTIHGYLGWLSVAIMGALWPLLVMTGMHRVFTPTIIQTIAETGKEGMVMPSEIGANLSLGGSSLAVAWKTKNPELRQTALAAAASAIMAGISEPALYGVAIRLKRPLIASLISGFICGAVAGMAGLASHSMAAPGLFTSVQFFDPANPMSIVWVFAVMALAVVLSFILTLLLGFEDIPVEEAAAEARKHQSVQPTVAKEVSLN